MTYVEQLISNKMLISTLIAWGMGQFLKVPIEYIRSSRWNWGLLFASGGMPSSHSSLITAATFSIGFYKGFDTAAFTLAVAITMIVTHDAAGVRMEAGKHAQRINQLIGELFSGHPISDIQLKEVIGHTRRQVMMGSLLGFFISWLVWYFWR